MSYSYGAGSPAIDEELETEANERLQEAINKKGVWSLDFREAYFFSDPNRMRVVSSQTSLPQTRIQDAPELNTDLGFELVTDFVTEIVNSYMPEAQPWVERGPGMYVDDQTWESIEQQVRADDAQIFEAIKASNFYSELPKSYRPDLAIGTAILWIDVGRLPADPIQVLAVPLREFDCALGPDGEIDDRFVTRQSRNSYLRKLLGDEIYDKIPEKLRKEIEAKRTDKTQVTWGYWRDWDRLEDVVWQHTILLKKQLIHSATLVGEGSCPCIPARFSPSADWEWGLGPLLQGMPSLRQIDELERQRTEHAEISMVPPITFPHDSFTAIEEGLEPGMAYPIQVGSQDAVKSIYNAPPANAANYVYDEKVHRLKRIFFIDFPEQPGDTPPTRAQWLDEMARAQRRIGTSGLSFWREGPAQYFMRFKYLLERKEKISRLQQSNGAMVSTRPRNPTQRAAEQQELSIATSFLEAMSQFFPEEYRMKIDGGTTMENFLKKMRAENLIAFRSQDQINAAVSQIQKLLPAGAPPGVAAGAPGAPPQ